MGRRVRAIVCNFLNDWNEWRQIYSLILGFDLEDDWGALHVRIPFKHEGLRIVYKPHSVDFQRIHCLVPILYVLEVDFG